MVVPLAECVRERGVWDELGDFWNEGSGPSGKIVIHALRLIATYLSNIGNDAEHCPGARDAMAALMYRSDWIDIDEWSSLSRDESSVVIRQGLTRRFVGSSNVTTGKTDWVIRQVHLGVNYVDQVGIAVDRLLWQAHRAFQVASDPSTRAWRLGGGTSGSVGITGSVYYLAQARALGSLALGGVFEVSNTIIHEAMRSDVPWSHCSNNCCQERVAAK